MTHASLRAATLAALWALCGCGIEAELSTRGAAITDGTPYDGHPSVGWLQLHRTDGQQSICTGTLVGQQTVLTAAHCVEEINSATFHVDGQAYPAISVTSHPGYTTVPVRKDVAVLRLSEAPAVAPTPIATTAPSAGTPLTLIGFGITGDGRSDSGVKRRATNTVADVEPFRVHIVGTGGGVGNICNGDSGGPSFATLDGTEVQVGVHSYGDGLCGESEWDARVDALASWIEQAAGGDVTKPQQQPNDQQPPQVGFGGLSDGVQVASELTVTVVASDDTGVTRVELDVDGQPQGARSAAPYNYTLTLAPGAHQLLARAYDAAGNHGEARLTVTVVDNGGGIDVQAPSVAILAPSQGNTVPTAKALVQAAIDDNVGISNAVLVVDGTPLLQLDSAPFNFTVDLAPGEHTLEVVAVDVAGNAGRAAVQVRAAADAPPPPPSPGTAAEPLVLEGSCAVGGSAADTPLWAALLLLACLRRRRRLG